MRRRRGGFPWIAYLVVIALELATIIREKQSDTIITHWKNSIHSDHEHAARLAERARFLAGLPMNHELPRHSVRIFLHAGNWEDMEGFHPSLCPHPRRRLLPLGLRHPAFARGETAASATSTTTPSS